MEVKTSHCLSEGEKGISKKKIKVVHTTNSGLYNNGVQHDGMNFKIWYFGERRGGKMNICFLS